MIFSFALTFTLTFTLTLSVVMVRFIYCLRRQMYMYFFTFYAMIVKL